MKALLEVSHLKKEFTQNGGFLGGRKKDLVLAVNDVSFTVGRQETLGVVGESGCGKTTLGRSVLRLVEPDDGEIFFDGVDVRGLNLEQLRAFRKRMQIVFQDSTATLDPRWTIEKTLKECITTHNKNLNAAEVSQEAARLLQIVGLQPYQGNKFPHELSGGQRQRIGIAKAVSVKPEFIVADEPVSALDVSVQAQVLNLFQEVKEEYRLSYLFISHDLSVVKFISDRIMVMYLGRIVELAGTQAFFANPLHPYSHTLLEAVPDINPKRRGTRKAIVEATGSRPERGCAFANRCSRRQSVCREEVPELREAEAGHFAACHLA